MKTVHIHVWHYKGIKYVGMEFSRCNCGARLEFDYYGVTYFHRGRIAKVRSPLDWLDEKNALYHRILDQHQSEVEQPRVPDVA